MRTWAPWRRSTRRVTTVTTRNGGALWRRNPFGGAGKTTRRKVIEQIKRGDAPWQKPWKPGEWLKPMSFELEGRDG